MNIGDKVSKAIKEGKWLNISYVNRSGENTFYWIAVQDINIEKRWLRVSIFNDRKSMNTAESWIDFDNIKSAEIIDFSSYDVPDKLITKIEKNLDKCQWLNYDHFNHNILNYYIECNLLDNDPSQKDYETIPGIDLNVLRDNKKLLLTDVQAKKIIEDIYRYDIKNIGSSYFTLAINRFSIDEGKKKFVICYHQLTFDPIKKSLILDSRLRFNQSFITAGRRHSLFNYINMDMDEFIRTFEEKREVYQELIMNNLRSVECINTRPDIMLIQRDVPLDLTDTYNAIELKYHTNELSAPLKAFFGNMTKRDYNRRKEPSLIILDKKININQMRVLYNSMKYPVTYVQGPPGTGKTQTIVNVTLSSFYSGKTMLICSSNNKPVDGIVEKIKFEYKGEAVNFPYLRLGNFEDIKSATLRIRDLYNYSTNKKPNDQMLDKIKISNDDKNAKLIELLNTQERRENLKTCLESSEKLIASFTGKSSNIIDAVKERIEQLKGELKTLPEATNEEITSLFIPLKENYQLSQFLYFKSLQYIEKLKKPRFVDLIEICSIEDDNDRVTEFNKWTQDDNNMKKLMEAFPIIFSTNISSRRLGTTNFKFDLVVMDEAGQCNVATALVPIAKAESLLLVGDPNQLKPVVILEEHINRELMERYNVPEKYNYKTHSILDVMVENDNISKYILLKYHYRCGRKIINFSNQRYYNNSLNLSFIDENGELEVLDVKNQNVKQKNEAIEEANAIADYLHRNNIHNAYIITPFVNQRELILRLLRGKGINDVDCGTIHSMQGAEKNTIIFSPAISPKTSKNTFAWIKDNYELINVAITRAKNKLVIAADTEVIDLKSDKKDDLYNLIQYAKNNGTIQVPPNESIKIEIGKSNGSVAEDEFFKTVSHFCSCYTTFEAERNVKITKIIKSGLTPNLAKMEFDLVLYNKLYGRKMPVIAFEINGGEHFGVVARERADKIKKDLCEKNHIELVVIPNYFVKAYEDIAKVILISKNRFEGIQMSMFDE